MKLTEIKKVNEHYGNNWPKDADGFLTDPDDIMIWLNDQTEGKVHAHDVHTNSDGETSVDVDLTFTDKDFPRLIVRLSNAQSITIKRHKVELQNLKGLPESMGGNLVIADSRVKSLDGLPKEIRGNLRLRNLNISSLEGCTPLVHGDFEVSATRITSLKGGPTAVWGGYDCSSNEVLTTLEGAPEVLQFGGMDCTGCYNLTDISHAPKRMTVFFCESPKITDLRGIEEWLPELKSLKLNLNAVRHGGLGILNIKDCKDLMNQRDGNIVNMPGAFKIIEKHLHNEDSLFECQQELLEAGLDDFAEL